MVIGSLRGRRYEHRLHMRALFRRVFHLTVKLRLVTSTHTSSYTAIYRRSKEVNTGTGLSHSYSPTLKGSQYKYRLITQHQRRSDRACSAGPFAVLTTMEDSPRERIPVAAVVVALVVALLVYKIISSLVLHPLASIPGPKYAAITHYYQFYYDVIKRGRFPWELRRLHQVYGRMKNRPSKSQHANDAQDPWFASVQMKCMSLTRISMTNSTLACLVNEIGIRSKSRVSVCRMQF
jgi:hypothetical protein